MRHSIRKVIIGVVGLSTLVLTSTSAAGALTLIYSSTRATYVPVGDPTLNTHPLQLTASGNPIVNALNFIYQDLVGDNPIAGPWMPINQTGPTGSLIMGEQRFDYKFGQATSINPGPPQDNQWNNNLTLDLGSFFLDGTCTFCGPTNAVSITSAGPTGQAQYIGEAPGPTFGSQNKLFSSIYNILFAASGHTGTLQYEAYSNITDGVPPDQPSELSGGRIIININGPTPPTDTVPSPMPLFGACAAFSYSRRLRRRISQMARHQ
jgi:hypothetical protein